MIDAAILEAQRHENLFPPTRDGQCRVVVGVSGGADSVCLLYALARLADRLSITLHVAHLDHNLRAESANDANFVHHLASDLNLPFHGKRLGDDELRDLPGGIEQAARRVRYRFLSAVAKEVMSSGQEPTVVVAHHANDQAESVLLHLIRGSGLRGLAGMQPVSHIGQDNIESAEITHAISPVRLVRPLLSVTRAQILENLYLNDISWIEDSSNTDQSRQRNYLRHTILPLLEELNPQLVNTLGRTANLLSGDLRRLERVDRSVLQNLTLEETPKRIVLDLSRLLLLDDRATRRAILRQALRQLLGPQNEARLGTIDQFVDMLRPVASGPHPLIERLAWTTASESDKEPSRISIHYEDAPPFELRHPFLDATWRKEIGRIPIQPCNQVELPTGWRLTMTVLSRDEVDQPWAGAKAWECYLDAHLAKELNITTPQRGDRFTPLGMDGQSKKLGDLMTDCKIPEALRDGWPILIDSQNRILWVCGLRVGHYARITNRSDRILHLSWSRK